MTTVACGGGGNQATTPGDNNQTSRTVSNTSNNKLADGQYPVQQAEYNDADGEYTLFLLNATPPTLKQKIYKWQG